MYNVLVSTNVAEEGLDIAECDLVVFYDVVASEIRLIQRKGRTARHRKGKVIILYCRNTNDEIYLNIALNKLNKMQKNLQRPNLLKLNEEKIRKKIQSNLGQFLSKNDKNEKRKQDHLSLHSQFRSEDQGRDVESDWRDGCRRALWTHSRRIKAQEKARSTRASLGGI